MLSVGVQPTVRARGESAAGAESAPGEPSNTTRLTHAGRITGDITPKSIVASPTGTVIANNMMYSHTSTLYDAESLALTDRLNAFACQAPRVFTHTWAAGDIAVWDNGCVLHRGRPWPMDQPRVMRHTRIAGDGPNDWALST